MAIREMRSEWGISLVKSVVLNLGAAAAFTLAAGCAGKADPDAVWAQAQAELRANRIADAERSVARLEQLRRPTDSDRLLRGQVAVTSRRPDQALAELALVPDASPNAPAARLLAGRVELRRNRFRHAERLLREAIRLHPKPTGSDRPDPNLIQAHRELIFIYGFQLRRAEISAEFQALSKLTSLQFDDLFKWGLLKTDSYEPGEAAQALADCIAVDPADRWSRLALAESQRRLAQLDAAEKTLAPLAADDPEAIAGRARIALDRGDARAAARLLAAGPPDDAALARLRGRLALSRRDGVSAERQFRLALKLEPDNHEAVSGLIAALKLNGNIPAIAALREQAARLDRFQALIQRAATGKDRSDPELPILLGDACADLHRYDEARGWYRLAVSRDPLDTRAQRALFHLDRAIAKESAQPAR